MFTRRGDAGADRRRARALQPARGLQRAREGQATRCARTSPRTCTASRSPGWRAIRAWSSRCRTCSAKQLYMHQFKINGKMAFDGDVWQWHQDYGTWLNDDRMPAERAMNVAIFLDDVNEFNGPLMFIPGSHKQRRGRREARPHDDELSALDRRQRPDRAAGRARRRQERRHRLAEGPGRLDDPVPRLPGARLGLATSRRSTASAST